MGWAFSLGGPFQREHMQGAGGALWLTRERSLLRGTGEKRGQEDERLVWHHLPGPPEPSGDPSVPSLAFPTAAAGWQVPEALKALLAWTPSWDNHGPSSVTYLEVRGGPGRRGSGLRCRGARRAMIIFRGELIGGR